MSAVLDTPGTTGTLQLAKCVNKLGEIAGVIIKSLPASIACC